MNSTFHETNLIDGPEGEGGATAVEYAVLLGLILAVAIVVVNVLGGGVAAGWGSNVKQIQDATGGEMMADSGDSGPATATGDSTPDPTPPASDTGSSSGLQPAGSKAKKAKKPKK